MSKSKRLVLLIGSLLFLMLLLISALVWFLNPTYQNIRDEEFEGVIFSKRRAANLLGVMLINDRVEDVYWMPKKAEIIHLEKQFDDYALKKAPMLASRLSDYRRQYFGFERDGRQLVLIIGFCDSVSKDWREEFISLPDAAGCYFEAQYDMVSDEFLYLWEGSER